MGTRNSVNTDRRNPWLQPATAELVEERLEPDELWGDDVFVRGPGSPAVAPPVDVSRDAPWPTADWTSIPEVAVVGLHGGAGASSLAALLGEGAVDAGREWPVFAGWERPKPTIPVVACVRTHHTGIQAAARFARQWAAGALHDSTLLGLVLIDDGPRLTNPQKQMVKRVRQMTPIGWHLPWQEAWRLTEPVYETSPYRVRRSIQHIRKLAQSKNGETP